MMQTVAAHWVAKGIQTLPNPFQFRGQLVRDAHINTWTTFTFIDILPEMPSQLTYETNDEHFELATHVQCAEFPSLIRQANAWLKNHREWLVFECESIQIPFANHINHEFGGFELEPNNSFYYACFREKTNMCRALRVWLKRRFIDGTEHMEPPQSIAYIDIRPTKMPGTTFQTLDELVEDLNHRIQTGEICGRIVTVEILPCPEGDNIWKPIPPEQCIYSMQCRRILGLRVYYEQSTITTLDLIDKMEVSLRDFVPQELVCGGLFRKPVFETLEDVFLRAASWISENPDYTMITAKCFDLPFSIRNEPNLTTITDNGKYLRILRIFYWRPKQWPEIPEKDGPPPPMPVYLSAKVFFPSAKEESIIHLKERLQKWTITEPETGSTTNFNIMGAETFHFPCVQLTPEDIEEGVANTWFRTRIAFGGTYVGIGVRVYYDEGFFEHKKRARNSLKRHQL